MNTGSARGLNVPTSLVATPIVQAAPTPADRPAATGAQPLVNRFAELLRRQHTEPERPTPVAPAQTPRADSSGSAESGDASAIEAKAAPVNAAKARTATPKDGKVQPARDGDEAARERDAVGHADRDETIDGSDAQERPTTTIPSGDRLDFRSVGQAAIDALRHLTSASSGAADDAARSAAEGRDATDSLATAKPALGHSRGMAAVDGAEDGRAGPIEVGRDAALRVAAPAPFEIATREALASLDSAAPATSHERALDALTSSLGVPLQSPGADRAGSINPTASLALPTPVDAPDFAAALGVEVSMLVQDGVQKAELHLNPAETGPVSIHITLDGTAARVDFGADVAATRAAIERGLPELASALRDAGFTLAGGGVSQHANGRAGGGDDDSGRQATRIDGGGGTAPASISAESRRVVRTVAAGGIDLYA